ncbi:MAG: DUF2794 domain-containing protein [Sphingomonadaceae bacterium]|nr:DUF2794 domain-containing protein [Sphingomonadaceae bacterium]
MGVVVPITGAAGQTVFDRGELNAILGVYGRMVAAGLWRDYAVEHGRDAATFSAFRRAAERPEVQVVKAPALRARQGMYALIGEAGAVLKRGHDLRTVLAPIERKLMRVVDG